MRIIKECIFWMMYTMVLYFISWDIIEAFPLIFQDDIELPYILFDIIGVILVVGVPAFFLNRTFHLWNLLLKNPVITILSLLILINAERCMDIIIDDSFTYLKWDLLAKELYDLFCIALRYVVVMVFIMKTAKES